MILPSRLADLIDCDRAQYRTWTIGTTAAQLKVPDNSILYILGFEAQRVVGGGNVQFSELEYRFITRDQIYSFLDRVGADGQSKYDAYIKTNQDVYFNTFKGDDAGYNAEVGVANPATKQPGRPIAAGTSIVPNFDIVRVIQAKNTLDYIQKTMQRNPEGSGFGPVKWNEYHGADFWQGTTLIGEQETQEPGKFPLITVHYVIVNKNADRI